MSSVRSNIRVLCGSRGVGCVSPWPGFGVQLQGEALWKQLQPLVLYHASGGVEDTFELLLNLLLGSHHNQLVVTCPPSSDQVSQGKASAPAVCKVALRHEREGEANPSLLPSLWGGRCSVLLPHS